MNRSFWRLFAAAMTLSAVMPLRAEDPPQKVSTPLTDPTNPRLWNSEAMMDTAVQQLSRRYQLTPEQEAFTAKLLKTRTRAFLKEHEADLRSLLAEAIELQLNPTKVEPGRMQNWSTRALPIFESARTAILDGNAVWRENLSDSQKKIHDRDLDQMKVNFAQMDEKFNRWSGGGFKAEDLYPVTPGVQPTQQLAGRVANRVTGRATQSNPEDFWEAHVNRLINKFKFTKEQAGQARAVLADCRDQASKYRQKNKDRIDALRKQIDETNPSAQPNEYNAQQKQYGELMKPIRVDMLGQLTQRVEALATQEQRTAVAAIDEARKARTVDDRRTRTEGPKETKPEETHKSAMPADATKSADAGTAKSAEAPRSAEDGAAANAGEDSASKPASDGAAAGS